MAPSPSPRIAVVQSRSHADPADNLERAAARIRQAAAAGAELVCLQELFRTPYFCQVEDQERFDLAESIPGPSTRALAPLAAELEVVLVLPLFERRAPGLFHNSAAVIDADGALLGVYRKMHIPDDPLYYEKFYFAPGDLGFRRFDTRHGRVGVLICWDQWFPEAARLTAMAGADVIFYPTAIGWHPSEKAQYGAQQLQAWRTILRSHAVANGCHVVVANRVGHEAEPGGDGLQFWGHSMVIDPMGGVLAEAGEQDEALLVQSCDLAAAEEARRGWPFFRDRRVDAYGPLTRLWRDEEGQL